MAGEKWDNSISRPGKGWKIPERKEPRRLQTELAVGGSSGIKGGENGIDWIGMNGENSFPTKKKSGRNPRLG